MKSFGEGKIRTGRSGEGEKVGPPFFRKVFPPFPNLPSHFQNNLRHADETADAARPPASAAPVLGNRRLAVRRGNRHGTFSGSGSDGLRLVRMDGQPDAPPSLLPAGGCVRHHRLVDRRKVRSPRPPSVPGMAGKEPVLTAGRHRGRRDRRFPRLAGSASANHSGRCGPRRKGTAPRQAGPDVAGHARRTSSPAGATDNRKPENPPGSRFPQPRRVEQ